jgi:hypothetical protein
LALNLISDTEDLSGLAEARAISQQETLAAFFEGAESSVYPVSLRSVYITTVGIRAYYRLDFRKGAFIGGYGGGAALG